MLKFEKHCSREQGGRGLKPWPASEHTWTASTHLCLHLNVRYTPVHNLDGRHAPLPTPGQQVHTCAYTWTAGAHLCIHLDGRCTPVLTPGQHVHTYAYTGHHVHTCAYTWMACTHLGIVTGEIRAVSASLSGAAVRAARPIPLLSQRVSPPKHLHLIPFCPILTLGPLPQASSGVHRRAALGVLTFTGHTIRHDGIARKAGAHGCVPNDAAHLLTGPVV